MKNKLGKEQLEIMHRNPSNWKGVLYFNRKDPRLVVPKINSEKGWTFNFASSYTYILISTILLIIVASQLFL